MRVWCVSMESFADVTSGVCPSLNRPRQRLQPDSRSPGSRPRRHRADRDLHALPRAAHRPSKVSQQREELWALRKPKDDTCMGGVGAAHALRLRSSRVPELGGAWAGAQKVAGRCAGFCRVNDDISDARSAGYGHGCARGGGSLLSYRACWRRARVSVPLCTPPGGDSASGAARVMRSPTQNFH
jgi:hypothetical protein